MPQPDPFADLAAVFHGQANGLNRVYLAIEHALLVIGGDPFEGRLNASAQDIALVLHPPAKRLLEALDAMVGKPQMHDANWIALLREAVKAKNLTAPAARNHAQRALEMARPQSSVGYDVEAAAAELRRIACVYDLLHARDHVHELRHRSQTLAYAARDGLPAGSDSDTSDLLAILDDVCSEHRTAAEGRGITYKIEKGLLALKQTGPLKVRMPEAHLRRCLSNIVHNAVKYNDTIQRGGKGWVSIDCKRVQGFGVLYIENWGVPITTQEIEQGKIFQKGYRGRFANRGGREGSGLGLYFVKQAVDAAGGSIELSSRRATTTQPPDYSGKFVTQVKLRIPLSEIER